MATSTPRNLDLVALWFAPPRVPKQPQLQLPEVRKHLENALSRQAYDVTWGFPVEDKSTQKWPHNWLPSFRQDPHHAEHRTYDIAETIKLGNITLDPYPVAKLGEWLQSATEIPTVAPNKFLTLLRDELHPGSRAIWTTTSVPDRSKSNAPNTMPNKLDGLFQTLANLVHRSRATEDAGPQPESVSRAEVILAQLPADALPEKISWDEDGDVVFSWRREKVKAYLTIERDTVHLLVKKDGQEPVYYNSIDVKRTAPAVVIREVAGLFRT